MGTPVNFIVERNHSIIYRLLSGTAGGKGNVMRARPNNR